MITYMLNQNKLHGAVSVDHNSAGVESRFQELFQAESLVILIDTNIESLGC